MDCRNHLLSLVIFVGIILLFGFPTIGIITLAVCTLAAFLDEVGNDSKWAAERRYVKEFFQYRFALKIVILIFAILGLFYHSIPQLQGWGLQYFAPLTFLYFLVFELSYELVGLKFDAIYNGLESFMGVVRGIYGSAND